MKKLISAILILILTASLFACKRADDGEGAADVTVPDREITAGTDAPEQDAETTDKTDAPDVKPTDAPDVEPTPEGGGSAAPRESEDTPDPEPEYTADMPFSPYEVVVTLTAEESAKGKTYTPADFPEVDVFNVLEFDYFPAEYYPDYADKTTLFLMLNEPSKENVLGAIRIIEDDERVMDACVNWYKIYDDYWIFTPYQEYQNEFESAGFEAGMREQHFDYVPADSVIMKVDGVSYPDADTVAGLVRTALNDPRIRSARPLYHNFLLNYDEKDQKFYYDTGNKQYSAFSTSVKYDSVDELVGALGLRDVGITKAERSSKPLGIGAVVLPEHDSSQDSPDKSEVYFYSLYWDALDSSKDNKREIIETVLKNSKERISFPILSYSLIISCGE